MRLLWGKHLLNQTFLKFCLVGLVNTAFGAAIMFLLYNLANCSYWLSSAANYVLGSILSFFLNKYFTFKAKHWSVKMIVFFILNIVVCYFTAFKIAEIIFSQGNLALFFGMCLFTLMNYLGQKKLVFSKD
ncbi:MAG: GtrA family protein [Fibromonadaceae bacterium]|nr:GtrA family protein [Fibromonadaceae bacterium]